MLGNLNKQRLVVNLDKAIRFFFYLLIFWLPYSPAVIESCVIIAFLLWALKRGVLFTINYKRVNGLKENFIGFARAYRPEMGPLVTPVALFLLACFLSTFVSLSPLNSLHRIFTKILEWFVIFSIVVEVFTQKKHVYTAMGILLFTAYATVGDSFVQFYVTQKDIFNAMPLTRGGATAGFHHANSLGGFLTLVVPLSLSLLFIKWKRKFWSLVSFFFTFTALWSLGITYARMAWFSALVGIVVLLNFLGKRKQSIFFVIILVCISLFYFLRPVTMMEKPRLSMEGVQSAVQWRADIWADTIGMARKSPLLGHGVNTYMQVFQEYRRRPQRRLFSPTYAHNCYLQIAAETGLWGLICFLWIIVVFFEKAIKTIRKKCLVEQSHLRILLIGMLSGICGFLTHSFFDTNFYSLQLSALLWWAMGITISIDKLLNQA